jgi:hypothetical protein
MAATSACLYVALSLVDGMYRITTEPMGVKPVDAGNRGSFISSNIIVGTDEFNSNYICRYPNLRNIY